MEKETRFKDIPYYAKISIIGMISVLISFILILALRLTNIIKDDATNILTISLFIIGVGFFIYSRYKNSQDN